MGKAEQIAEIILFKPIGPHKNPSGCSGMYIYMPKPKFRFTDLTTDISTLRTCYRCALTEEQKRDFAKKYRAVVLHYKIEWSSLDHNLRKEFGMLV